ncbi:hypothetical protein XF36_24870 [Pseudonocardia sp. HH130629-09]|nr:hypothetical protein XF36_24870 [Pseudonocardia sp. HH130629-09]
MSSTATSKAPASSPWPKSPMPWTRNVKFSRPPSAASRVASAARAPFGSMPTTSRHRPASSSAV